MEKDIAYGIGVFTLVISFIFAMISIVSCFEGFETIEIQKYLTSSINIVVKFHGLGHLLTSVLLYIIGKELIKYAKS